MTVAFSMTKSLSDEYSHTHNITASELDCKDHILTLMFLANKNILGNITSSKDGWVHFGGERNQENNKEQEAR